MLCSCNSNGQANSNAENTTNDSVTQQQPREAKLTFVGDFLDYFKNFIVLWNKVICISNYMVTSWICKILFVI